jgi:hypothetical protein
VFGHCLSHHPKAKERRLTYPRVRCYARGAGACRVPCLSISAVIAASLCRNRQAAKSRMNNLADCKWPDVQSEPIKPIELPPAHDIFRSIGFSRRSGLPSRRRPADRATVRASASTEAEARKMRRPF